MYDIVISFDTTGSMYPVLAEVRRKIQTTVKSLFETIPDLRIGILAHGDYNDEPYTYRTLDLTNDINAIDRFVRSVDSTNGYGNGGECYELAMHVVANDFSWRDTATRSYILIGDEPAHEYAWIIRPYGNHYGRNYPTEYQRVEYNWKNEAHALINRGITCYVVRCLNRTDSKNFHDALANIWQTPLLHLHQMADINELVTAVLYKERGILEQHETQLGINNNLRTLIDSLLGRAPSVVNTSSAAFDPTRFQVMYVPSRTDIKEFVESTGARFRIGHGYYQLVKSEEVQERKEVILWNRDTNEAITGDEARKKIGLPYGMRGKVRPYDIPNGYQCFIQSTSNNRKLDPRTQFLYEVDHV